MVLLVVVLVQILVIARYSQAVEKEAVGDVPIVDMFRRLELVGMGRELEVVDGAVHGVVNRLVADGAGGAVASLDLVLAGLFGQDVGGRVIGNEQNVFVFNDVLALFVGLGIRVCFLVVPAELKFALVTSDFVDGIHTGSHLGLFELLVVFDVDQLVHQIRRATRPTELVRYHKIRQAEMGRTSFAADDLEIRSLVLCVIKEVGVLKSHDE